jgi:hypothetical protein
MMKGNSQGVFAAWKREMVNFVAIWSSAADPDVIRNHEKAPDYW